MGTEEMAIFQQLREGLSEVEAPEPPVSLEVKGSAVTGYSDEARAHGKP